jgi:hypothetical protein
MCVRNRKQKAERSVARMFNAYSNACQQKTFNQNFDWQQPRVSANGHIVQV